MDRLHSSFIRSRIIRIKQCSIGATTSISEGPALPIDPYTFTIGTNCQKEIIVRKQLTSNFDGTLSQVHLFQLGLLYLACLDIVLTRFYPWYKNGTHATLVLDMWDALLYILPALALSVPFLPILSDPVE